MSHCFHESFGFEFVLLAQCAQLYRPKCPPQKCGVVRDTREPLLQGRPFDGIDHLAKLPTFCLNSVSLRRRLHPCSHAIFLQACTLPFLRAQTAPPLGPCHAVPRSTNVTFCSRPKGICLPHFNSDVRIRESLPSNIVSQS